jgi:hypothetical protein
MPAAENAEILDAMADQIRAAVVAVTDIDVQVEPRRVTTASPPTIDMYPGDLSRGTEALAFGLNGELLFTVRARVNENDNYANQDLLLAFMDDINPLSIAKALVDDPTLGGLASSLDCVDPTGFVTYLSGEQELLGFQFQCKVIRAES